MPIRDLFIGASVAFMWAFNFIVIDEGLEHFPPLFFSALRFSLSALPVLFIARGDVSWKAILAVGAFLGLTKFSLLFIGMDLGVSAGVASLLLQSQAAFTVAMGVLILKQHVGRVQLVGILLTLSGMLLLLDLRWQSGVSISGLVLILVAGLAWAASNISTKVFSSGDPMKLVLWMSIVPPLPLFLLSFSFETGQIETLTSIGWKEAMLLFYTVAISTILGFTLWTGLIKKHGPALVAPFSLLVPVFCLFLSAWYFDEPLQPEEWLVCGLVLVGLMLITVRVESLLRLKTAR